MSAFRDRKTTLYTCSACGWSGLEKECAPGEFFSDVKEIHCPRCDMKVGVVSYATYDDVRENWDQADDLQKLQVLVHDKFNEDFAARGLKSPDQLPDIEGECLRFTWDNQGDDYHKDLLILHGSSVIWREPASYGGFKRFEELCAILKQKYGDRIVDLVPSPASLEYLYGDSAGAEEEVARTRGSLSRRSQVESKEEGGLYDD